MEREGKEGNLPVCRDCSCPGSDNGFHEWGSAEVFVGSDGVMKALEILKQS